LGAVHHCNTKLLWDKELANCWVDTALKSFPPDGHIDVGGVRRPSIRGLSMFWELLDERCKKTACQGAAEPARHSTIEVE
jgi:hypothetical protein